MAPFHLSVSEIWSHASFIHQSSAIFHAAVIIIAKWLQNISCYNQTISSWRAATCIADWHRTCVILVQTWLTRHIRWVRWVKGGTSTCGLQQNRHNLKYRETYSRSCMLRASCFDSIWLTYYIHMYICDYHIHISHNISLSLNITRPLINATDLDILSMVVYQTTKFCSTYSLVAS